MINTLLSFELYSSTDVDECEISPSPCDESSADCINADGNFTCECHPGYTEYDSKCIGKYSGLSTMIILMYPTYDVDQSTASVYICGIVLWLGKYHDIALWYN